MSVHPRTERRAVMAIVALVVLVRSAIFVFWEQSYFDSDQAVIGLMGKHLSEGRAFPMFLYGQSYIFAVEAWMAAAVFLVAGVSVAALKLPLLVINVIVGLLLVWLLDRDARLAPGLAAAAAVFFVLPPPGTASELLDASGVNLEPFLYVLLMWMTRRRPAWCGVIFAIGFLQREFTLYALAALAIIGAASGVLFTREGLRRVFSGLRAAVEVWLVVAVLKPYSSAAGPGTSVADIYAPSNNVRELLGRICFDPGTTLQGFRSLVMGHWVRLFGLQVEPLIQFAIDSRVSQGVRGAWVLLTAAMLLAVGRVAMSVVREKRVRPEQYFCAYLTLVGLISAVVFVVARCGAVGPLRYALLSIFAAIGVSAWYLQIEQRRRLKLTWLALVGAWALVAAIGHGRLWTEYLTHPPLGAKRLIIKHLQARGVRYGIADYWNAYYISFLTKEQIIVKSDDFRRINEYDRLVDAHLSEAVRVSRQPCADGQLVMPGVYFCSP
jgi:hypothetical protein